MIRDQSLINRITKLGCYYHDKLFPILRCQQNVESTRPSPVVVAAANEDGDNHIVVSAAATVAAVTHSISAFMQCHSLSRSFAHDGDSFAALNSLTDNPI